MLNIDKIRQNIILKDGIYYFDWTASGLGYMPIEDEIKRILKTYANTHSECSECSNITTNYYENARVGIKKLLNLQSDFLLLPCGQGSSAAIKKFQEIMGIYIPPATKMALNINFDSIRRSLPLVIVGPYEHHSNEISYRVGACEVVRIPLARDGGLHWGELDKILKINANRKIIISISAASNVTGIKTDIKSINSLAKKYNAIIAIDASSLVAYENIDSSLCDAIFISPHKLLGGVGSCGILAIRKSLFNLNLPTFSAGGTVSYVSKKSIRYLDDIEQIEDAGTPAITQLIRAYLAFELRNRVGLEFINRQKTHLMSKFEYGLSKIKGLINYAPQNQDKIAIYAFNIKDISPFDLAQTLSLKFGIQSRAGCSCAGPYGHDLLGLRDDEPLSFKPGWLRVSLHWSHSDDDVDYLLSAINQARKYLA
nr:aminotransferase class V-fold PLP-dependent enzyme [Campylobacter lanienae]